MNVIASPAHSNIVTTLQSAMNSIGSAMNTTISTSMISDQMSEPSSPESTTFDDSDLLNSTCSDDVTAQLAAAGPIGVAAAAAIATGRKRKRPHSFETNPSIRKRQQTRLLRKLKNTIEEYTTRVGQQAVVLCCTPGKPNQLTQAFKVFGSQPLENVLRNCRGVVLQDLEAALAQQTPPSVPDNPALHELPPLIIDGIPTPVDKMTQAHLRTFIPLMLKYATGRGKPGWGKLQWRPPWWPSDVPWANVRSDERPPEVKTKAQLRAFIPEMLKYSTGRSKPGWGKAECRPVWWPSDLPWANVRSDVRTEEEKKKVSWTHALRTIVKNCYKHHGREDLLPEFDDHHQNSSHVSHYPQPTMVQTINNPDGTVSIIQIDTGEGGNTVVTLADGTQAQLVQTIHQNGQTHEATQAVQTLAEVAATQHEAMGQSVNVELSSEAAAQAVASLAEASMGQDGPQIILTGDASGLAGGDGSQNKYMVTIPVSMYQTVVTSIAQLNEQHQQQQQQQQHPQQTQQAQPSHVVTTQGVQVAMAPTTTTESQSSGDVPDATHAVEVMTVEQS